MTSLNHWHQRYDYRIKYWNLKRTRSQNALALEDVERLWIPFLVFDNTKDNEATRVKRISNKKNTRSIENVSL